MINASLKATPCIGVMCIDVSVRLEALYGRKWRSYMAASNAKYLEAAGAHVVPVWIGRQRSYYATLMDQLNGILLPGGAIFVDEADVQSRPDLTNEGVRTAEVIYQLAMERNKKASDPGGYFPLFGICLGMQLLLINAAQSTKVRTKCQLMKKALPVCLTEEYRKSKLFMDMPNKCYACHYHGYCITQESLKEFGLATDWQALALQKDPGGHEFISLIEHRRFPIFGSQFHPERSAFEQLYSREDTSRESHSRESIQLAERLCSRFVDACRLNRNQFASAESKSRHLIWNFQPVFSGKHEKSNWLQCYLFEKNVDYPERDKI
ncbi:gamma-glutamyl hydrolase isoform X1 [Drosophila guanche]|uniref:folate gamma-glutamyl hydrolase n=2 Tax=Drosophila guanche TaxID=7266 RepID=A0A3B0K2Z0_DROGU|nr:gamma-glutamyl hydrolase isoform X1 [Drosophila guanche]SPP87022.1 blast:Gamma-glutamyl hydrolase [Drosophila guanche]